LQLTTIQQIEEACRRGEAPDFSRNFMEGPILHLQRTFYPYGFPLEVRTNREEVFALIDELWAPFEKKFDTEPIRAEVMVNEKEIEECPPEPQYRLQGNIIIGVADSEHHFLLDLNTQRSFAALTSGSLAYGMTLRYYMLDHLAPPHISTTYATSVHAGFVSLDGRGVLLMGDSGAGKSTLSFACARAGWTYTADDSALLLSYENGFRFAGNCHKVRLRPHARELFPEVEGLPLTPRAAGKPSIELPTAPMRGVRVAQVQEAHYIVFINRTHGGPTELVPYPKDVVRYSARQFQCGPEHTRERRNRDIERLLELDVYELRYTDLDEGIARLEALVRTGS
jgi:hypothetical protein